MNAILLTASDCPHCARMRRIVEEHAKKLNIDIEEVDCLSDKAIHIALDFEVEDIPALIIGNQKLFGETFTEEDVVDCLKKGLE